MKRSEFSSLDRPRFATFSDIDDYYEGVIVTEPEWTEDPLDSRRRMLQIVIQDDAGVFWQLNARTQMPTAVDDALVAADVDEIVPGGRLGVRLVEMRGNTKVYKATYEAPADSDSGPMF